jgi:urease accessory protein UreE
MMRTSLLIFVYNLLLPLAVTSFVVLQQPRVHTSVRHDTALAMGLYDDELPPRPQKDVSKQSPRQSSSLQGNKEPLPVVSALRLFQCNATGHEINNRLPVVTGKRWHVPSDSAVKALLQQVPRVHVDDACMTLDACRGNMSQALECIAAAQEQPRAVQPIQSASSMSLSSMEQELIRQRVAQASQQQKLQRSQALQEQVRQDAMRRAANADQQWLPGKQPRPVNDEPWFTG